MTLYFEQASIIAAVVCSLIVAGLLKGTIGVGMPVVALPLLSLFIDVKSAAMLLSMPLVFSNVRVLVRPLFIKYMPKKYMPSACTTKAPYEAGG